MLQSAEMQANIAFLILVLVCS